MTVSRRRFVQIIAGCALAGPVPAAGKSEPLKWRGRALGVRAEISVHTGNPVRARTALAAATDTIRRMERLFSLYEPASALLWLNQTGHLSMPPEFARLVGACDEIHEWTKGLFDPTVQPLMVALAAGAGDIDGDTAARLSDLVGWQKVLRDGPVLRFAKPGMALTFNGIAQGFATDRVTETLAAHGFDRCLVSIGEYRAGSDPARIGIAGQGDRLLDQVDLKNAALATSSPTGTAFRNGRGHIVRPDLALDRGVWRSVTVEAETATIADGISTALALAPDRRLADSLLKQQSVRRVWLENASGAFIRL
ncbi:MAG: FAD:protein FMN transferase [Roseibium sp.]|nr:FAD:protein FMN transferase [Roseibium sp.]